jgi:hypothetical protein
MRRPMGAQPKGELLASALIEVARGTTRPGCCAPPPAKETLPTTGTRSWGSAGLGRSHEAGMACGCIMLDRQGAISEAELEREIRETLRGVGN